MSTKLESQPRLSASRVSVDIVEDLAGDIEKIQEMLQGRALNGYFLIVYIT